MFYIAIYTSVLFILTTYLLLVLNWCFYLPLQTVAFCLGVVTLCGFYYLIGRLLSKHKDICPGNTFMFTSTIPTLLTMATLILISTSIIALNLTESFMKSIGFGAILFLLEMYLIDLFLSWFESKKNNKLK